MKITPKSYKETKIYQTSNQSIKDEIKTYKQKYNLDNENLYYALRLYDLKHLDKELVRKASSGAQYAVIFSALSFVAISANNNIDRRILLINAILFLIFLVIYLGGFTNQFTKEKRALRKILKKNNITEEFITNKELKEKEAKEEN